MKVEIVERKENKIFDREELKLLVRHSKSPTPTLASAQAFIAKILKTTPDHIEILRMNGLKGTDSSIADVIFWKSKTVKDLSKPKTEEKSEEKNKAEGEKAE